jgi:hypothetical protein
VSSQFFYGQSPATITLNGNTEHRSPFAHGARNLCNMLGEGTLAEATSTSVRQLVANAARGTNLQTFASYELTAEVREKCNAVELQTGEIKASAAKLVCCTMHL